MTTPMQRGGWQERDHFLFPDGQTIFVIDDIYEPGDIIEFTLYAGNLFKIDSLWYADSYVEYTAIDIAQLRLVHYLGPSTVRTPTDPVN